MFSLQELFSPKDKFFDLLEASAEEARASVKALIQLIENPAAAVRWRTSPPRAARRSKSPARSATPSAPRSSPPWNGRTSRPCRRRFTKSQRPSRRSASASCWRRTCWPGWTCRGMPPCWMARPSTSPPWSAPCARGGTLTRCAPTTPSSRPSRARRTG